MRVRPAPRVLFVIRGKLGDTLTTYASVRAFADAHADWETVLLVRRAYAPLLEGERGVRLIPVGNKVDTLLRLLWERLTRPEYDVLAALWAFGKPLRRVARLIRARRRIHFRGGHADLFPEGARLPPDRDLYDPGWETARMVAGDFPKPRALRVPALERRYREAARPAEVIGVAPVADELRKNFDTASLHSLLKALRARHPSARFRVFVNPRDHGTRALNLSDLPEGAELRKFRGLRELRDEYLELSAWYGTDTGLYHVAVAMGIPSTVFFGPTQPWKIVAPAQEQAISVRIAALGRAHCEVVSCTDPACLHHAVALWCGTRSPASLDRVPANCPLRAADGPALERLA